MRSGALGLGDLFVDGLKFQDWKETIVLLYPKITWMHSEFYMKGRLEQWKTTQNESTGSPITNHVLLANLEFEITF